MSAVLPTPVSFEWRGLNRPRHVHCRRCESTFKILSGQTLVHVCPNGDGWAADNIPKRPALDG